MRERMRAAAIPLALVVGIFAGACDWIQTITQSTVVNPPAPVASPATSPAPGVVPTTTGCPAVVTTTLGFGDSLSACPSGVTGVAGCAKVGAVLTADITPRAADGTPVPVQCHDAQAQATAGPSSVCTLGGSWGEPGNTFTPSVLALAPGTCVVSASSNGRGESKQVQVIP